MMLLDILHLLIQSSRCLALPGCKSLPWDAVILEVTLVTLEVTLVSIMTLNIYLGTFFCIIVSCTLEKESLRGDVRVCVCVCVCLYVLIGLIGDLMCIFFGYY